MTFVCVPLIVSNGYISEWIKLLWIAESVIYGWQSLMFYIAKEEGASVGYCNDGAYF